MINPLSQLTSWFNELHDQFGDDVPSPDQTDKIIALVSKRFNTKPIKCLGAGDNGIAYRSSNGTVVKFTIDKNEALLWTRLKGTTQTGIASLKDIVNLSSSKTGNSIIYVINVEYAPKPLEPSQVLSVRKALAAAREATSTDSAKLWNKMTPTLYRNRRTNNLVKQFAKIATVDPSFKHIPDMIIDLADKYGGHVYDLQPDNFRIKQDSVVLVDPSVPDLTGTISKPEKLLYEDLLELSLNCMPLRF